MLKEFLDYQRESLIGKLGGLTLEKATASPTASSLTLLGLIKHSAIWERRWFQTIIDGQRLPDGWPETSNKHDTTFRVSPADTIDAVIKDYRAAIAASDGVLLNHDLDAPCNTSIDFDASVRWVALHMIEETARHAGHADILRETIDGVTGR